MPWLTHGGQGGIEVGINLTQVCIEALEGYRMAASGGRVLLGTLGSITVAGAAAGRGGIREAQAKVGWRGDLAEGAKVSDIRGFQERSIPVS